jgi:hypothetical protein
MHVAVEGLGNIAAVVRAGDLVKMKGLIEAAAQHLAGRIDDRPRQSLVERQIELAIETASMRAPRSCVGASSMSRPRERRARSELSSVSSPAPMDGSQTVMKYLGWWSKVSYVVPRSEDIDLK